MPMKQIQNLTRSVIRLLPAFAITSVTGCIIAFLLGVPVDKISVVVAVPLIVAFLLSRLLILIVPRELPASTQKRNRLNTFLAVPVFLSMATAAVLSISSGLYYAVGLRATAIHSLAYSGIATLLAVSQFFVFVFVSWAAVTGIHRRLMVLLAKESLIFWDVMRAPTELSLIVFGDYEDRL